MAFKVKNLVIHVLPSAEEQSQPQLVRPQDCISVTPWRFTDPHGCVGSFFRCVKTFPGIFGKPSDAEELAALRVQLQEALASVQAQEQALGTKMSPQTVEEAQALEANLAAALEEVQRQKEDLQNKATGGQG